MLQKVSLPISPSELRQRVYRGEILHFSSLPAIEKFGDIARQICESTLVCTNPTHPHDTLKHGDWLKAIYQFQLTARRDKRLKQLFSEALQSIGLNLQDTFCDQFIFRVVPPKDDQAEGTHSFVDIHRDTWGAGINQQLNWWAPLYPYDETNGIQFYLDYFERPIANNTAKWRYEQFKAARQQQSPELKPTFKSVPCVLEKPSGSIFRPLIQPGELLCFSAAHLHGSGANHTPFSRFSYETRTVNLEDIRSGEKAPNVDNDASAQLLNLFSRLSDARPLTAADFKC